MDNSLFTQDMLNVLLNPECWAIVGTAWAPANRPICNLAGYHGSKPSIHKHDHREILIVLGGSGAFASMGSVYECRPGTVFVFDSFEEHQLGYLINQPDADHLWIFVHEKQIAFQVDQTRAGALKRMGHLLYSDVTSTSVISNVFSRPNADFPEEFRQLQAQSGLVGLVLAIVKEGYLVPTREDTKSFQRRVIFTVRDHILDTAGAGESLDSLARISGYSKYHFLRLFKEHVGMSVHEFLDHSRVERVAELKRDGKSSREISELLGFASPSSFSRWYGTARSRHGLQPMPDEEPS